MQYVAERGESECSDEANVLNTEVEESDSQETQCDELRQLVDAQPKAEPTLTTECSVAQSTFAQQAQRCGSELDSLESFSCSWATRFRTG